MKKFSDMFVKVPLDHKVLSQQEKNMREFFYGLVRGQKYAVDKIVSKLLNFNNPTVAEGPTICLLLLGPEGLEIEDIIKATAQLIYGNPDTYTKFICKGSISESSFFPRFLNRFLMERLENIKLQAEIGEKIVERMEILFNEHTSLKEKLEIAKRGNNRKNIINLEKRNLEVETEYSVLAEENQRTYNNVERTKEQLPFGESSPPILFFEGIDFMGPTLQSVLIDLIRYGKVRLSNGEMIDLCNSVIFLTCNTSSREVINSLEKIGYKLPIKTSKNEERGTYRKAVDKIHEILSKKLFSAIGKENFIVFDSVSREEMKEEVVAVLSGLRTRIVNGVPTNFIWNEAFIKFLVEQAYDMFNKHMGRGPARKVIAHRVEEVIGRLIRNGQEGNLKDGIIGGERILFDIGKDKEDKDIIITSRIEKKKKEEEEKEGEKVPPIQDYISFRATKDFGVRLPPPRGTGLV